MRVVQRDVRRLRDAALRVQRDLRRASGDAWECAVDGDYVLTLRRADATESVMLERDLEDEAWYVRAEFSDEQQASALDADADDVVASEAIEVLRVLGWSAPLCGDHNKPLSVCSGVWLCEGPPGHDVAVVGELDG